MLDSIISFVSNPLVLITTLVPAAIVIWEFVRNQKREPKELNKLEAETKAATARTAAADAAGSASMLEAVNLMLGFIREIRETMKRDLDETREAVKEEIHVVSEKVDRIDSRLKTIETEKLEIIATVEKKDGP